MERAVKAFTAVYLRSHHGYVGFIEELPGAEELIAGKEVVRESFLLTIPGPQ